MRGESMIPGGKALLRAIDRRIEVPDPSRHGLRWRRGKSDAAYHRNKRILDLSICVLVFPIALPIFLICAAMVKASSPGPIFFVQERTGIGGRRFQMLKFRTMIPGAANMKDELEESNIMGGPDFKLTKDPRVTVVGDLLRRSSLDEAPQIWNVLRGDMSLVGPRPTSFSAASYELWHTERLEAMPGLTGLWQVAGRGEIDFDDRVRLDIAYVRNRSLPLDLLILLRTVPAVLSQRGAY